jgi:hypothetical protein
MPSITASVSGVGIPDGATLSNSSVVSPEAVSSSRASAAIDAPATAPEVTSSAVPTAIASSSARKRARVWRVFALNRLALIMLWLRSG